MSSANIKKTIRRTQVNLFIYFLLVALVLTGSTLWLFISFKKQVASIAVTQAEPNIIKGDYRGALAELGLSLSRHFTYIQLRSSENRVLFTIPPRPVNSWPRYIFALEVIPPGFESNLSTVEFGVDLAGFSYLAITALLIGGFSIVVLSRRMKTSLLMNYEKSLRIEQQEAFNALATQVSHDIRSPLSALNMALSSVDLPFNQRSIIKNAAGRINDIADDLLSKYKVSSATGTRAENVPTLNLKLESAYRVIQEIHSEKLAALDALSQVSIRTDVDKASMELQIHVDRKTLLQALSNLINNAVEAIDGVGQVTLALRAYPQEVSIVISDNGKGIEESVLTRLGRERVSHGKERTSSGSGIGVLHARQVIEAMGGRFHIQSRLGIGTQITLTFSRVM